MLPHWFCEDEAIAAVLVSYHNLGDLYFRCKKSKEGLEQYQQAQAILERAAEKAEFGSERHNALLKALRCNHSQLLLNKKNQAIPSHPVLPTSQTQHSKKGNRP